MTDAPVISDFEYDALLRRLDLRIHLFVRNIILDFLDLYTFVILDRELGL